MDSIKGFALQNLVPILASVLMALAGMALHRLQAWLKSKTKDQKTSTLIDKVESFAEAAVARVEQTLRPDVVLYLKDGRIDETERAKLQAAALAALKAMMGQFWEKDAKDTLGLAGDAAQAFLLNYVEKAVAAMPATQSVKP